MQYDFDEVIERRGTGALKYEALLPRWGRDDLIPLWVADMDFRTRPIIMQAIRRRCEHEILGYTVKPRAFFEAIRDWVDRRHGWKVNASEIGFAPGIVPGISSAIQCFTEPGDKIMIQPPVYHPFAMIIRENGREIVNNPLILENGRYRMDFNHMKEAARGCRMFILCNPHNPVGIVWTEEELRRMMELCLKYRVPVVSDEIHCEIVMPGCEYVPYGNIDRSAVVCTSPSKAFNTAGLHTSNIVCPDADTREAIDHAVNVNEVCDLTCFGVDALKASYTQEGADWVDSLCDYIWENYRFFAKTVAERLPECPVTMLEATYLPMIDVSAIEGYTSEQLEEKLKAEAGVWVNAGEMYGREGFLRVNLACPRATLAEGLDRLCKGLSALKRR